MDSFSLIDTICGVIWNELGFVDGEMLEQEPAQLLLNPFSPDYDLLVVNIWRLLVNQMPGLQV